MKRLTIFAIMAMMILSSCGKSGHEGKNSSKSNVQTDVTSSESVKKNTFVKELSYKDFIKDVWDFETYPDSFAYKGKLPCVIDFYATWCGPCKKVAPVIEKLASEYDERIIVYKVDVDKEQRLAYSLNIKNIPTIYFLGDGKQPSFSVGAKDEVYYTSEFNRLLK